MNDKVKHYLNAWRVKGNIYASEKAAKLGSYFGATWFKDKKLFLQGSPKVICFTTREETMKGWEKAEGLNLEETFPKVYKEYVETKNN